VRRGKGNRRIVVNGVVTSKILRRVIEHAIAQHGYDPNVSRAELKLGQLDLAIQWRDAVRASDDPT
jgi:hypothetical protein